MPYIRFDHEGPEGESVRLGMWKVEEPEDFFLSRLNIYENEERILASISHPTKRLEWLSSRLCLKELLKITHRVESLNESTGKPYLSDNSHHISYSHSNLVSAAIASSQYLVAIDLEDLSKKRNKDTRFLFMHPSELAYYEQINDPKLFYLIWSSKETLYKLNSKRGVIVFKENLIINPEQKPIEQFGTISGIIQENGNVHTHTIYYRFFPSVLLTYTVAAPVLRQQ